MVYHNEINDNGIIKSVIDKKLLQELYKNYHSLSMEILKELCPEKLELYEYSDFTIIVTDKDSKFPIHDDTPNKLLSGVIYLAPENNSGTIFYNDKVGHGKTEIEWKTNRAVFFSRKEMIFELKIVLMVSLIIFVITSSIALFGLNKFKEKIKWEPKEEIE